MLLNFTVSNFLSIDEEQTLSLVGTKLDGPHRPIHLDGRSDGALPCAIIYGPNASGKSNLLLAIQFLRNQILYSHSKSSANQSIPRRPFLLNGTDENRPTVMEASFILNAVRYDYGFSLNDERYLGEWLYSYPEGRRRKLYERTLNEVSFGSEMKGTKKVLVEFMRPNSLFISTATQNGHEELSAVSDYFDNFYFSSQISVARELINSAFTENQIDPRSILFLDRIGTGVVGYRQTETDISETVKQMALEFFTLFRKHSNDDFPDIQAPDKDVIVELSHRAKNNQEVFFGTESESSGTRRLLLILNEIFRVLDEGTTAVIDEIDASLHTHAVEAIIHLFCDPLVNDKGAQLIATTHDTNLLASEILRRDEVWFAEKSFHGSSSYYSLAEVRSRKTDNFESLYLEGRYGAVPSRLRTGIFAKKDD